ncbi:MAG: sle [Thermoleophilia bacterium]|nr:sle [Thermoleophilia bacterium]
MTPTSSTTLDSMTITGRSFARSSADGVIDGQGERGVYADDLRMIRRVEAFRANPEISVPGRAAIGDDGAAIRFELDGVLPGEGVLLLVELDGTDIFTAREIQLERRGRGDATLGLGDARPRARVNIDAICTGAVPDDADGVARAPGAIDADGHVRTASWTWRVPADAPGPVNVTIEFRSGWALITDEQPPAPRTFNELDAAWREWVGGWLVDRPLLEADQELGSVYRRSLEDLAGIRLQEPDGSIFAAGLPWAATVVGRDAMLSAWMALPIDPQIARSTLLHLARHQSAGYDLSTDAAPGKIQHDERRGAAAERWHERYYGAVDSTPLFLMLLGEACAWSGTPELAMQLEANARAAVAWIEARIDEDELGLVAYVRRATRGLDVQGWKRSSDSQQDRAGGAASGVIRPIEVQAYSVAALRTAAHLARTVWSDPAAAQAWTIRAEQLAARIPERYLVEMPASQLVSEDDPRRGAFFAHAVDGSGLPLDASCSNIGHVLWAGALSAPDHVDRISAQLLHPSLNSGWGIRTLSTLDAGFEPASLHNGSVWPHDSALCAAGIARTNPAAAARIFRALIDGGAAHGGRVSEPLVGADRGRDERAPTPLTGGNDPLAVAAASPLLMLRTVLGLEVDAATRSLVSRVNTVPSWARGLAWRGVHALGRRWDVVVGDDLVVVITAQ